MSLKGRIVNCILCGALGDAFGADIESMSLSEIREIYGHDGKKEMETDADTGTWAVTDDTQMTLFTMEGLILSHGMSIEDRVQIMYQSYLRWFNTQYGPGAIDESISNIGELWKIQELYRMRWPGHACIDSLRSGNMGTIEHFFNDSMGNGTVMRSAPFGFLINESPEYVFELSCRCAAITHGNPDAQASAGLFSLLIYYLLHGMKLSNAEVQCMLDVQNGIIDNLYFSNKYFKNLPYKYMIYGSRSGAQHKQFGNPRFPHAKFFHELEDGWTAPQALGLGFYYTFLNEKKDIWTVIRNAANIEGDSDTVASIAGNLFGASHNMDNEFPKEINRLQFSNLIIDLAEKMYGQISSNSPR